MELHTFGIILLIVVAVDALSLTVLTTEEIIIDDRLIIVFETTLVDGQHLVCHE